MKPVSAFLFALLLSHALHAWAEPPELQPLIGTWTVDLARLPMPPEARPQRVTIIFGAAEGGRLAMRVEVVDPSGALRYAAGENKLDGSATPVEGNLEADTSAARMPAPGVLVMQLVRAGVPGSTRVYTVSADGQSMIETAANVGDDGRPFMRTNYFSRVE